MQRPLSFLGIPSFHVIQFGLLLFCDAVFAYKEPTHGKLAEASASSSVLARNSAVLRGLGLQLPIDDDRQSFQNSNGEPKNILNLIEDGADFEDDTPRPVNHFYDPLNDRPLTVGIHVGYRSPDWALEDKTDFGGRQEFASGIHHRYVVVKNGF